MGTLQDYYRKYGTDEFGQKFGSLADTSGLDPSQISTTYTASKWKQPTGWYGGAHDWSGTGGRSTLESGPAVSQVYSGPGGRWTSSGGVWQNEMGKRTADLGGYLKKGSLQQTGADFSDYQNQLKALLADPSKIQQTAGYQFQKGQGEEAINRSAAARGALGGGGVLAELAKYGQGLASQEYGGQVSRLADLMRGAQQFGVQSGYYQDLVNPPQVAAAPVSVARSIPSDRQHIDAEEANRRFAQNYQMNWGV